MPKKAKNLKFLTARQKIARTQEQVAAGAGVSRWTIINIERDRSYLPNADNRRKLRDYFREFDSRVNYDSLFYFPSALDGESMCQTTESEALNA